MNTINLGLEFIKNVIVIADEIIKKEAINLDLSSTLCATTIINRGIVHVFGTGHSSSVVLETAARTGSIVGFHPIIEYSLSIFSSVIGSNGHAQATYIERLEGFGKTLFNNYDFNPNDVFVLVSHSGINPVIVDLAIELKKAKIPVIAITSETHSKSSKSRHSSNKRLFDIADIVIDTHIPYSDTLCSVPINNERQGVGAASSLIGAMVLNAIQCDVASKLIDAGVQPVIMPNPNSETPNQEQRLSHYFSAYKKLIKGQIV